ncbi:MAG TPA: fumarate hydratase, partial [Candidatus Atribacteria bacterium]|nr:fumarate hydratase [Candidatus Atribacteria bacterium]
MKELEFQEIVQEVERALQEINIISSQLLREKMLEVLAKEDNDLGQEMLSQIMENYVVAEERRLPLCQDTGMVMAKVEKGEEVRIKGGSLRQALDEAIR